MRNTSNTQLHFTVFPLECSDKSRSVTCALTSLCLHKSRSDVYLICETTHSQIKKYNKFGSHIGQSPESLCSRIFHLKVWVGGIGPFLFGLNFLLPTLHNPVENLSWMTGPALRGRIVVSCLYARARANIPWIYLTFVSLFAFALGFVTCVIFLLYGTESSTSTWTGSCDLPHQPV